MDKKFKAYISEIVNGLDCDEAEKKDLLKEMGQHLQLLKEEYIRKGLSEKEAVDTAIRCFGKGTELKKGLNHSLSTFNKPFLISVKIVFGVYAFVVLSALLFLRLASRFFSWYYYGSTYNPYFRFYSGFHSLLDPQFWYFNTNFIPLRTISLYFFRISEFSPPLITYNLLYNIILFAPLGLFVPILFRKRRNLFQVIKFAIISGFIIEALQFILQCGVLDIDDVILYTSGSAIGYTIFVVFNNLSEKYLKRFIRLG